MRNTLRWIGQPLVVGGGLLLLWSPRSSQVTVPHDSPTIPAEPALPSLPYTPLTIDHGVGKQGAPNIVVFDQPGFSASEQSIAISSHAPISW